MTPLAQLARNARLLAASGKAPFCLDDPGMVWLVRTGRLDVFAAPRRGGVLRGPRTYLFSAVPDDILAGHDPPPDGRGLTLVAVGLPGTEAACLDAAAFFEACRHDAAAREALTRNLLHLGRGLGERIATPPRGNLPLAPGTTAEVRLGHVLRPADGLVFVRLTGTEGFFCGTAETGPEPGYLPLTPDTWISCAGSGHVHIADMDDMAGQGGLPQAVAAHQALALACLAQDLRVAAVDTYNIIKQKAATDRRVKSDALSALATALDATPGDVPLPDRLAPLTAVCALAAKALGAAVPDTALHCPEPPRDIFRAAELCALRVRQVSLRGRWWRDDSGPMAAFLADGSPVALIPPRPGRYRMLNPATGQTLAVTPEVAARIEAKAYAFIRPFADRPLTGWELVRLGLRGTGRELSTLVGAGIFLSLLGMAVPVATAMIYNDIIPGADTGLLFQTALFLGACAMAGLCIEIARNIAMQRFVAAVDQNLEPALWDRLLRLPAPFFRCESPGSLAERAEGLWYIRHNLSGSLFTGLFSSVFAFANLFLMLHYNAGLAKVALLVILIVTAVSTALNFLQGRFWRKYHVIRGQLSGLIPQIFAGMAKLKLSGSESRAFALWAGLKAHGLQTAMGAYGWSALLSVAETCLPLAASLVLFSAAYQGQGAQPMPTGSFLAFLASFGLVQGAVLQLSKAATDVIRVAPAYQRLQPILSAVPESRSDGIDPGRLDGGIETVGLGFRYEPTGPPILTDVHIQVRPGQFVALAGPSGSGKSTLLRLFLGFERPESGSIYYDDQDMAEFDLTAFRRRNIGVVLQNGVVFPGDLFSNISGSRDISMDEAWEAARAAGLATDIESLPMGMHTPVSAGVGTLSGGQRQRLLIARALAGKPRILFLDEATSALDNRSQDIVSTSIEALNITRVVVAHRLSTIQGADRIYFLEAGQIVEAGTHEELMALGGRYRLMALRQLA